MSAPANDGGAVLASIPKPYSPEGELQAKARMFDGPKADHRQLVQYLLAENYKLPKDEQLQRGELNQIATTVADAALACGDNSNGYLPAGGTIETFTAESLMSMDFPEAVWVVPELLPTGAALLVAKPKFGKSWLALSLCCAVGYGGKALSRWDVPAGEALYIALEDPPRRLKSRLQKLLEGEQRLPRVHFWTACPRLLEGGTDAIRGFLDDHPDTTLVVVDTLEKVRDARGKSFMYIVPHRRGDRHSGSHSMGGRR